MPSKTSTQHVLDLPIDQLQPNPLQPRGAITSESLVDLTDSIKQHGVLEPLVIAKTPAGYQIVAGERRWKAAKLAGLTSVPCLIKETTPQGMLEMALVENVQRTDLNPIDRAKAFERLLTEFNLSNNDISKRIGKSPSYISNTLRILKLPDALKDGLLTGMITEGHARALAAIDNPQLMVEAYKQVLKESASVRRTEELARRIARGAGQAPGPSSKSPLVVSHEIDQIQQDLLKAIKTDHQAASVKLTRSREQTKLLITLKGNLDQTESALQFIYRHLSSPSEALAKESPQTASAS
jgi:ParB family chromosome partitioning protein